ncbi:MAG: hypothetical protein WC338_01970 [Candidatus Ratteibacteria bacterium]|jgi:hypothetical protein
MNRIEKDNFRSLKREKLKSFLSERRSQKDTQARAKKETARRLTLERRTRLALERVQARQRKESERVIRKEVRVKTRITKSDKTVSLPGRPKSEKRNIFRGLKIQSGSGEDEVKPSFSAPAKNRQAEKRQKLLSYLEKQRVKKSEIIAEKIKQKEAVSGKKRVRRAELKRQKEFLSQQKLASQSPPKAKAAFLTRDKKETKVNRKEESGKAEGFGLAVAGRFYKRQQLLSYLKKRKAGQKTFAVQRRELKKIAKVVVPEVPLTPVVPEVIPVVMPVITLPPPPPEIITAVVPETVSAPPEEFSPVMVEEKKSTVRRFKLSLARGKKSPSDTALPDSQKVVLPPRNPFHIVSFLKAHSVKIVFLLLVLGWFAEITMLNRRLESVRKQIEQATGITKAHISGEAIITDKLSSLALGTTRVEGIRDPFSNELWRIREITPSQARAVPIRTAKIPAPSSIIKPVTPILITKSPEFTLPEVARAIPDSAKLTRIPQVTVPQVGSVSTPSAPVSGLRFRGILNVAGIDYFFVEGANGGYRVRIGDTVEGFKIYDYRNGILYFAKDGYTYQFNEERVSPPLRYRGRMIKSGQEYLFLEDQSQKTHMAVIGEEIEGYRLIKLVGDYLYFIKDDRLYYLKKE